MNTETIMQKRMEGSYKREMERNERLRPIYDQFGKGKLVLEVYEVGGSYQIVKFEDRFDGRTEIMYEAFVDYKPTRQLAYSLELSVLIAIAHKNEEPHSRAPYYAAKVLNIKDETGE